MAEQQRATLAQTFFLPTQVRAVVNRFLLSQVGSVFAAGTPELDGAAHLWHVPVLYNPPDFAGHEVGQAQGATRAREKRSIRIRKYAL